MASIKNRQIIVPAIIADEWKSLTSQIESVAKFAKYVQIDVMDGELVPSVSFPFNKTKFDGRRIPFSEKINFDAHLMIRNPLEVGMEFIMVGAKKITAQIEGFYEAGSLQLTAYNKIKNTDENEMVERVRYALRAWRSAGADVGLSIMLDTPFKLLTPFLDSKDISSVQIMSISRVGYQGEEFDERAVVRIKELRLQYPDVIISVDGSVNERTLKKLLNAGANIFNIGSAIMKSENPNEELLHLQELLENYA